MCTIILLLSLGAAWLSYKSNTPLLLSLLGMRDIVNPRSIPIHRNRHTPQAVKHLKNQHHPRSKISRQRQEIAQHHQRRELGRRDLVLRRPVVSTRIPNTRKLQRRSYHYWRQRRDERTHSPHEQFCGCCEVEVPRDKVDDAEGGAEAEEWEDEVEKHGGLAATLDDARCHLYALLEFSLF